jgi:peptide chain release factor 1
LILEVRSGEGGDDSKLFVHELAAAYIKYAQSKGLKPDQIAVADGHLVLKVSGSGVWQTFRNEPGKHCVQRCPPTERNSRRHTSIVVVAVLPLPDEASDDPLDQRDVDVKTQGGSGPGGQHQNKTDSAVRMTHRPTGIQVFINGRDQQRNRRDALRILTAKVNERFDLSQTAQYAAKRKDQIGDGGRSNKVRTYNFVDSRVVDHRLRKRTKQIKQVMKGHLDLLLE